MRGKKEINMGLIEELKKTESLQGEVLDQALSNIKEKYNSSSDKEVIKAYLVDECKQIESELVSVNKELDSMIIKNQLQKSYEILPISYIAKNYFNKSTSWLYQRINGTKVRGRVYTLNEKEKAILNNALKDIAKKIGSISIV